MLFRFVSSLFHGASAKKKSFICLLVFKASFLYIYIVGFFKNAFSSLLKGQVLIAAADCQLCFLCNLC